MYTADKVAEAIESIAPRESGVPGDELGFVFGDPMKVVNGVACLWNVHAKSILSCAEQKLDLVICHEGIWLPAQVSPWYDGPKEEAVFANRLRRGLLEKHGFVVYRSHSNWDALAGDGVPDQALAALGIAGLREVARRKFFSVSELPEACTVGELKTTVENGLGYSGCRVFGDAAKVIRRFAFLIGGFGENQHHMPQAARDLGAEALIFGEMSEFIVMSALEMDLPVIEALHSVTEIPAVKRQAVLLSERLPGLPVKYVPSGVLAFP